MLKKNSRKIPKRTIAEAEKLNALIIDAIQDVKGLDIIKLDLHEVHDASADFFIICHGNSITQVMGIANNIERRVEAELGISPNHIEGTKVGSVVQDEDDLSQSKGRQWILIDYFNVVVHVFSKEKRPFYNLEYLWSDAKVTTYENLS
jgi:ribosome-associated protein